MMQRTSNENAACKHRICKRSDQPKIDRIANNDMIKFFSFFLGVACVIFEHITNVWQATCRAQRAHLLRYWPWVWWKTTKRRLWNCSYHAEIKFMSSSQFVMEIEKIKIFKGQDIEDVSRWREFMNFKFYIVFLPREHNINMFEFRWYANEFENKWLPLSIPLAFEILKWKICRPGPGCSSMWIGEGVNLPVKHSCLFIS